MNQVLLIISLTQRDSIYMCEYSCLYGSKILFTKLFLVVKSNKTFGNDCFKFNFNMVETFGESLVECYLYIAVTVLSLNGWPNKSSAS